jgi:Glycine cleavage system H protein (lipoate-binding)
MATVENVYLPDDRYYDPQEHLWVKVENEGVRIGIDALGRWAAGTIVYVDLHAPGKRVAQKGAAFGTLEADKFVGALRAPVRGIIKAVNHKLLENPAIVNTDPYDEGWFVVLEPTHLAEDLKALVHGEGAIVRYLQNKIAEYRERGILPESETDASRPLQRVQ